jgi:hypothetical protein
MLHRNNSHCIDLLMFYQALIGSTGKSCCATTTQTFSPRACKRPETSPENTTAQRLRQGSDKRIWHLDADAHTPLAEPIINP